MKTTTATRSGFGFQQYVRGGEITKYDPLGAAKRPVNPPPPPTRKQDGGGGGGGQQGAVCPPPLPWPLIPLAAIAVVETIAILIRDL